MIEQLNYKKFLDVYDFLGKKIDKYQEFYIYFDHKKIYLQTFLEIKKALKYNKIYGSYKPDLKGLLTVCEEKNKVQIRYIAESNKISNDLIRYLLGNWGTKDIYITFNKANNTVKYIQRFGFRITKIDEKEIILYRKKEIRGNHGQDKRENS
jgi:hypothetical protein